MVSADYIVGLTDGEGCFYVNIRNRKSSWSPKVETHFYIKLREDNKDLLDEIHRYFGCGAVYYQKENRPNHSPCYRFEINAHRGIISTLIPFFERHSLQGTKSQDFEIFRSIAFAINNGEHKTEEGFKNIVNMKMQMTNHRTRWMREIRSSSGDAK